MKLSGRDIFKINYPKLLYSKIHSCSFVDRLCAVYSTYYAKKLFKGSSWEVIRYSGGCRTQQSTHPDILYDRKNGRFVMTVSHYPFEIEKHENSYVFTSTDGIHFENVCSGALEAYDGNGDSHFSDGDIIQDEQGFHVYYRFCERDSACQDIIHVQTSKDLETWQNDGAIISVPGDELLSPAVIKGNKTYRMYYVKITESGSDFLLALSDDYRFPNFGQDVIPQKIQNMPEGYMVWHINVTKQNNDKLIGVFTLSKGPGGKDARLFWAEGSLSHNSWTIGEQIHLDIDENKVLKVYRSAFVSRDSESFLYVSLCTVNDCWFVVRRKIN